MEIEHGKEFGDRLDLQDKFFLDSIFVYGQIPRVFITSATLPTPSIKAAVLI